MIRAVLALAAALLSACSASVDGSALPAADPALVSAPPQTGAAPLAVEPGHLEPLALAATDVQTMVGTRPFAVVDPGHKGLFGPTDLVRPECSTWITVGLLTSYAGSGWIDAWVSTMTSGPVVIGDPARRYVGQAITAYPSPEAGKAALARIAAELGKCAQDQYVFNDDTVPSWITDKVVFADLNRVAAYVDRQMTETMRSGRIPANTAAVLTALNLADDLMRAQDEVNRLRRELALLREKR